MFRLFEQEVKEKKLAARSSHNKTNGRRSKHHMFPIDFMSSKQQKEYTKGGNVVVSNLYDQISTLEKYNELTDEQKKKAMTHWRNIHSTAAIKRAFNWNDYYIYKEFERIGIEVQKRSPRKSAKSKVIAVEPRVIKEIPAEVEVKTLPAMKSGISFFLYDEYNSEEIVSKIMKYAAFLEGEKNKFRIRLEIEEVKA